VSLNVETYGTARVSDETIEELVRTHFDLRPGAIIRDLRLRRPIYRPTAIFGHFGRTDIDAPWENTDRAEELRAAAGLGEATWQADMGQGSLWSVGCLGGGGE